MASWEDGLDKHLLTKVNAVLASGQFIEPLKEAAADEEILDEMDLVEKAFYTAARQAQNESETDFVAPSQVVQLEVNGQRKYTTLATWTLTTALWNIVYERMGLPRFGAVKLGIKKGFKIVRSRVQKPSQQGEKQ